MRALAHRVILAHGPARVLVIFASGALGALAMPPVGFWPALAASLSVAVWIVDGCAAGDRFRRLAATRRAAFAGWLWGFGYFVGGLWWIGAAFLVEADLFAWLMPFGILGLPAILAVFPAIGFALARALWSPGPARILALAFGLAASEWLRGHLFTGFPWNALGMAFGQGAWLMQSASVFGQHGLTLLVVAILAAPATIGTAEGPAGRWGAPALALLGLLSLAGLGAARIAGAPPAFVPGVNIRMVQPNLDQAAKFGGEEGGAVLQRYLDLSARGASPERPGLDGITHLVWPESAFPFLLHREPAALSRIADALPAGATLITGAARSERSPEGGIRYYNAIQVVGSDGGIAASYDKVHLVPFGEYVPAFLDAGLRALGLRQFVTIPGGFTPGDHRGSLAVPGIGPVAASICYEAIFPDEVLPAGARPVAIVNVTNDGWFGATAGPYQHFAQARLRAVERGLPLVRAANTGISAIVDPYGRASALLSLGQEGVLDGRLPAPLSATIFDRAGNSIFLAMCFTCFAIAVLGRRFQPPSPA